VAFTAEKTAKMEFAVATVYFDGTAVASSFNETLGIAPLNYLQIYSQDIQYATATVNSPAQVVAGSLTVSITAQALLNLASAEFSLSVSRCRRSCRAASCR
jgi:hypothetical protein